MAKEYKLISWNVNGIRAAMRKGFTDFMEKEKPHILCLQEIKAEEEDFSHLKEKLSGYELFANPAEKKGYAGTAIFTKRTPKNSENGIGKEKFNGEGRVITLEFPKFFLVNVYVPNSGRGLSRLSYRSKWDTEFLKYLKSLKKKKQVIACGDFNVAHKEIDLARPKQNYNKTAGYTQDEIDGFENILEAGFIDIFREMHPEKEEYTYWSYMFNARKKNIGWRVDYFLVSQKLKEKIKSSKILSKVQGSDHCPVEIILKE